MREKLLDRLENDYIEIQERYLDNAPRDIFNDAYRIATINEFYDILESLARDEDETSFDTLIKDLAEYKGNLLDYSTNKWFSFRHPQHFDFFYNSDCVINIAEMIITEYKKENK